VDYYGRIIPKHAHGTANLSGPTSSTREITEAVMALFDRVVDPKLLVRRLNITADTTAPESGVRSDGAGEQMDLFRDFAPSEEETEEKPKDPERERRRQDAVLAIRKRYGKNAILKGMNFEEGATARDRNSQIGGHKA
jgi:DNA polymerase V